MIESKPKPVDLTATIGVTVPSALEERPIAPLSRKPAELAAESTA